MNDKENLTKDYIFDSFKHLLEKKKYNEISVCDICEKAGVSRMSFYRNFKSKDELTYKGIEKIFDDMKKRISTHGTVSTYLIAKELFETAKNYQKLFFSFDNTQFNKEFSDIVWARLMKNFEFDTITKTSKYIPVFYFGALAMTLLQWLKNGCEETPDEMARMIASLTNIEPESAHEAWFYGTYACHNTPLMPLWCKQTTNHLNLWLTNKFSWFIITPYNRSEEE